MATSKKVQATMEALAANGFDTFGDSLFIVSAFDEFDREKADKIAAAVGTWVEQVNGEAARVYDF